jgi:hypothetical protein
MGARARLTSWAGDVGPPRRDQQGAICAFRMSHSPPRLMLSAIGPHANGAGLRIPAAHGARGFACRCCPSEIGGRREGRVPAVPMARLQQETQAAVTTGTNRSNRPSLRDGVNGFLRALPGERAVLPPSPARSSCELDASVAAPGPRVFAVRVMPLVSQHGRVHRIPPPTSVTIAKRPSDEGGTGEYMA